MTPSLRIPALLLCGLLAACGPDKTASLPAPHEPGPGDMGTICHMALDEHIGPKGQVFLKGQDSAEQQPLWFSSIRDTFTWLLMDDGLSQTVSAVWVNDMGRSTDWDHPPKGAWVEAHQALYVINSDKSTSMGAGTSSPSEIVPFADRTAAETFARLHGGKVVTFKEIDRPLLEGQTALQGGHQHG